MPFPADDHVCCVPRYGLPVNFQAMLLQPNRKSVKRLRDVLNVVFKHLDEVAAASIMDVCIWTASARAVASLSQMNISSVLGLEQHLLTSCDDRSPGCSSNPSWLQSGIG